MKRRTDQSGQWLLAATATSQQHQNPHNNINYLCNRNNNHCPQEREEHQGDNVTEEKKMDPPVNDDDNDCTNNNMVLPSVLPSSSSSHPPQSPSCCGCERVVVQSKGGVQDADRQCCHRHQDVGQSPQHTPTTSNPSRYYYRTPAQNKARIEPSSVVFSSSWTDHTSRRLRDRTASYSHGPDHPPTMRPSLPQQQQQQQLQQSNAQQRECGGKNKSDSRIILSWQQQKQQQTTYSTPSHHDPFTLIPSSITSHQPHPRVVHPRPTPSLSQVEFPPLSSVTVSNVVKGGERGKDGVSSSTPKISTCLHTTSTEPITTTKTTTTSWIDAITTTKVYATNNDNNNADESTTSWMNKIPPLPLLDTIIQHSENKGNREAILDSSYYNTTMSTSAILNDIGTLFVRMNRTNEARVQYRLCITNAKGTIKGYYPKNNNNALEDDMSIIVDGGGEDDSKVVLGTSILGKAAGLARFRCTLLYHGGCCGYDMSPVPTSSSSSIALDNNNNNKLSSIVQNIHQHQKLDCPTEYTYSCNGLTPLGLEYICDPLPVLGSILRKYIISTKNREIHRRNSGVSGIPAEGPTIVEWMALIASQVNIASLEYRLAEGGNNAKLQQVLTTLEMAAEDCDSFSDVLVNDRSPEDVFSFFGLLQAVVHSNIGTVKYRLNRVRESWTSFEKAKSFLEKCDVDPFVLDDGDDALFSTASHQSMVEPHDDNRFPPHRYVLLAIHLNLSRVALRLNQPNDASEYCNRILAHNDSTKPRLVRRILRSSDDANMHHHHCSPACYCHPKSTSHPSVVSTTAAFVSVETAMLAYEHDVDRRFHWLRSVAEHYITGLIYENKGNMVEAWHHYNRLLSIARVKLDHRHVYICSLLERRGAVLFEQRKLQCSMLSYLACLKILEHHQTTGSNVFNEADLSRVLYAVGRVLHDREEYRDALHMYHRALKVQRVLATASGRPSLDIIKTLCNISRVHHLSGEIDAALGANREVMTLALTLLDGKMEHPFLIHRLKIEGNILVEVGRLEDAISTFAEAARRCSEDGRDRMMSELMGGSESHTTSNDNRSSSQEDADAGDSSVLSIRSAMALAQINFFHPAAASA